MSTTLTEDYNYVKEHIRMVPDFPKKGILFLDITTALKDAKAMRMMTDFLYEKFKSEKVDYVAGIESRGFIFGAALAYKLGCGFITIRKPNKLPAKTIKEDYTLEYGTNTIEIHEVVSTAFIIELNPLKGREKIEAAGAKVVSMLNYDLD